MSLPWISWLLLVAITSDIVFSAPSAPVPAANVTETSDCSLLQRDINRTHVQTGPILVPSNNSVKYRIATIGDMDSLSFLVMESDEWCNDFGKGYLVYNQKLKTISVELDSKHRIGELVPIHGYGKFNYVPDFNDTVTVAIQNVYEVNHTVTYFSVYSDGSYIVQPFKVDKRIEGFKFI